MLEGWDILARNLPPIVPNSKANSILHVGALAKFGTFAAAHGTALPFERMD